MTGTKPRTGRYLNGSWPSQCPGEILNILSKNQVTMEKLLVSLGDRWGKRSVHKYLKKMIDAGEIERILTHNGMKKLEYRVKKR